MKTFILILFFAAFCFLCFKIFSKKKKKKSGGKPSVNSPRVRPNENDVPNIDFDRDDNLGDRFLKK